MIIQSLINSDPWQMLGFVLFIVIIGICFSGLFERKVIMVRVDRYLSPEERNEFLIKTAAVEGDRYKNA